MRQLNIRLARLEEEIIPEDRFAIVFKIHGKNEDYVEKQITEYKERWGEKGKVTFVIIIDYLNSESDDETYENFLLRKRKVCSGKFADWWVTNTDNERETE